MKYQFNDWKILNIKGDNISQLKARYIFYISFYFLSKPQSDDKID